MCGETAIIPSVHELRRRWKPHKERLSAVGGEQSTSIRFHRACSWMAGVEQMPERQDQDLALVSPYWRTGYNLVFAGKREDEEP